MRFKNVINSIQAVIEKFDSIMIVLIWRWNGDRPTLWVIVDICVTFYLLNKFCDMVFETKRDEQIGHPFNSSILIHNKLWHFKRHQWQMDIPKIHVCNGSVVVTTYDSESGTLGTRAAGTLDTRAAEHKGCNWGMQIDWWLQLCAVWPQFQLVSNHQTITLI